MEGVLIAGGMVESSMGMMDLGGAHHQENNQGFLVSHTRMQELASLPIRSSQECCESSFDFLDFKDSAKSMMNCSGVKPCTSDENDASLTEEGTDNRHCGGKEKKSSPWQRVKWTDSMVKLLIKAVIHVDDDIGVDGGRKKSGGVLPKKGKWKSVSAFMVEKGDFFVSPQQCEDKFNDLNKRYKRLNEVLGRGTACKVVENPTFLDSMTHISEKMKDDVRKILGSKHLFYEEMCFYHNGNRPHVANDSGAKASMRSKDQSGNNAWRKRREENEAYEQEIENEERDEFGEYNYDGNIKAFEAAHFSKKFKVADQTSPWGGISPHSCTKRGVFQNDNAEKSGSGADTEAIRSQWMRYYPVGLETWKLELQVEALELEKQRFKWQRICAKKDRDLKRMGLENERMKLENERLALQLKLKTLHIE